MVFMPRPGASSLNATIRILLTVLLFVGVGYLFWKNYERSLDLIFSENLVVDETNTLSSKQREELSNISANLEERFGFGVRIQVFDQDISAPEPDTRKIFIGLSPELQESEIVWPPVLKQALPGATVQELENRHFARYWPHDWPRGLYSALNKLGEELLKIEQE